MKIRLRQLQNPEEQHPNPGLRQQSIRCTRNDGFTGLQQLGVPPGGDKLQLEEHIFRERDRETAYDSRNSVAGVVVIFLDQRGGVAAASLEDIRFWAEGRLTSTAFIKNCSLDPPGAFGNPAAVGRGANR